MTTSRVPAEQRRQADREDHWPSNYMDCYAYQDANFGYFWFYFDRDD